MSNRCAFDSKNTCVAFPLFICVLFGPLPSSDNLFYPKYQFQLQSTNNDLLVVIIRNDHIHFVLHTHTHWWVCVCVLFYCTYHSLLAFDFHTLPPTKLDARNEIVRCILHIDRDHSDELKIIFGAKQRRTMAVIKVSSHRPKANRSKPFIVIVAQTVCICSM